MARYRITAPVLHVVSTIAGVNFADSVAETDNENAVAYFRRHGYEVVDLEEEAKAAKAARAAERKAAAEAAAQNGGGN